jgi:hypothetical protein
MLREGRAEALLVAKLDRLTRSVVHLGELVETYFSDSKSALLSVGEQIDTRSAAGRLVLNILASVSHYAEPGVMPSGHDRGAGKSLRLRRFLREEELVFSA